MGSKELMFLCSLYLKTLFISTSETLLQLQKTISTTNELSIRLYLIVKVFFDIYLVVNLQSFYYYK